MGEYGYRKSVAGAFDAVRERTEAELQREGFGIVARIDMQETLKKKLDVEIPKYLILGVCNPPFAKKALEAEREVGLFLPCNVIVYEDGASVTVSAVRPTVMLKSIGNSELDGVAKHIEALLKRVVDRV